MAAGGGAAAKDAILGGDAAGSKRLPESLLDAVNLLML